MDTRELDARQLGQLRQRLDERERELEATIAGLRDAIAAPASGAGPEVRDSVEDGDARAAASVDLVQLQRHEDELREVRHARDRMHQGEYGRCEECDEPIPLQRLLARPEARYCMRHEEAWEKAHPRQVTQVQP
jgi:DnaK suppressor protein